MRIYTLLQISYNPTNKNNTFSTKILHLSANRDIIQEKFEKAEENISELYRIQEYQPKIERVHNMTISPHDPQLLNSVIYTTDKNVIILSVTIIETDELPKKETENKIEPGDIVVLNKDAYSDFQKITHLYYEPNLMICTNLLPNDQIKINILTLRLSDSNAFDYFGSTYNIPKTLVHKQK